ncbi:MAG: FAD-binding oxidoreductase [Desulfobacteraceae bacterium]|nr:MAG: FAD-binding oxidoreductase [Desulfobacteraceae bacterium]
MPETCDALIIGSGITGASIAFELSKMGYRTLNVDKLSGAGLGSTSNTCAIIRTTYSTLEGTAIAYDSYFSWRNWEEYLETVDETGMAKFYDRGFLVMKSPGYDWSRYFEIHDQLAIPYETWDRKKLLERMPHFVDDSFYPPKRHDDPAFNEPPADKICDQVVLFPSGGYINDAVLSVHNVQRAAENKGARFLFNREVTRIHQSGSRVTGVELSDGSRIDAPIIVNAAGPHSFVINRMAGIEDRMKIKTRALRHEVHFVPSPEQFSYEADGMVVSDGDQAGYHRPETGNLVLVGSEDPACDELDWVKDPDNYNREITDDQYKAQVYRLSKRIPTLPIPNKQQGIVDLYDVSDDWIPIYDATDLKGFYLAIGTSGNQYKNGPVVGQLMAEIIDACEKGHDHDADPVQVELRHIDFSLNTGIFSRNRDIIENSTFSVLG